MKVPFVGLLALVVVAAASTASAQDISGAWDVTLTTPQGENTVEATITQTGEKITGQLVSPLGSVDITGTLVKDALDVAFSVPIQGNPLEIKLKGTVAGDTISGTADFGGLGEAPWTAKRKPAAGTTAATPAPAGGAAAADTAAPAAAAGAGDANGKWDLLLNIPQFGAIPITATFNQQGEKLTGTLTGPQGEMPVSGTFSGKSLKLEFTAPTPNGPIPVTMTGELGADGFSGKASLGGFADADWTATRSKQ